MSKFNKADDGKSRVDLIESKFILGIGHVLGEGAIEYGENNWKNASVEDIKRIRASLMRHTLAVLDGEVIDKKSGKPHTYHIGCNAMFLDYFDRMAQNAIDIEKAINKMI